MKYLDEFRNPEIAKSLVKKLKRVAKNLPKTVNIMEICGGHTMSICKYGIHNILPENIRLVSGPGCPVCVTPGKIIDSAIWLSQLPKTKIFTFGDMLKVPGGLGSLIESNKSQKNIKIIYSPLQTVEFATKNPEINCILLGVGFETTAPMLAMAVKQADEQNLKNFYFLSAGKLTPPAMHKLLEDKKIKLDAFIAPGHVTTVVGANSYKFIEKIYEKPTVVAGFELCDILAALIKIIEQLVENRHEIEIEYSRTVTFEGNKKAQEIINKIFVPADDNWRGLGLIPQSGYNLQEKYFKFDVFKKFNIPDFQNKEPENCRCADVLKGICLPIECSLFGKKCSPNHPIGPCMVSSEGSCAAHFKYSA